MLRFVKWVGVALVLLGLVVAGVLFALQRWVASADFRGVVQSRASAALGVPVTLGAIDVDVWPLPAVSIEDIRVATQPPLTVARTEARPVWANLLQGRLVVATLLVRQAVVPEQALAAVGAAMAQKARPPAATPAPPAGAGVPAMDWLPRRLLLDDVSWVDAAGRQTAVDAQVYLAGDGWPDSARVKVLRGRLEGGEVRLQREAAHWAVSAEVGGGSITGKLQLTPGAGNAPWQLQGQFDTANVEVSAFTAPARPLTGRLQAQTALRAQAANPAALPDALRSETRFTVSGAVVHGIDLVKAVQTVGLSRGGETRLDTLAGQVVTQGKAAQLNNLVASSGLLSATGNVALAPDKSLTGRVNVQLAAGALAGVTGGKVQGAVAVPLAVGGTLDAPSVTLTRGAMLGAAIGTLLAPGVGTGAGAQLGDKLGQGLRGLFGK